MDGASAVDRRGISEIERAEQALARRSGAARKLWRLRSVALLADLFHDLCDVVDAEWLIECGAHAAEASVRFVATDERRRAIALEANPFTFAAMTASAAAPRLTVLSEGVAAVPGRMLLTIPSDGSEAPTPSVASFLVPAARAGLSTVEVAVDVTTLDVLQQRFDITGRVALWIDVEGMSREVLEGGARILTEGVVLLVLEAETASFWTDGGSFDDADRLVRSAGLEPLARDSQQDGQFNMIYVRPESFERAAAFVERYLEHVTRPVPLRARLRHAARSARKQGLRRATAAATKELVLRTLGEGRAVRLKSRLAGGRRSGTAD